MLGATGIHYTRVGCDDEVEKDVDHHYISLALDRDMVKVKQNLRSFIIASVMEVMEGLVDGGAFCNIAGKNGFEDIIGSVLPGSETRELPWFRTGGTTPPHIPRQMCGRGGATFGNQGSSLICDEGYYGGALIYYGGALIGIVEHLEEFVFRVDNICLIVLIGCSGLDIDSEMEVIKNPTTTASWDLCVLFRELSHTASSEEDVAASSSNYSRDASDGSGAKVLR
ncbi:hypothetical protein J5N97_018072 [Dioscorea zingiberensis]|uniref:Uncharacterized protein n=1 Tax=Dioscorea zingiberensis TaxID=325984 RepID=A0A9D5CPI7_9LILI|nr:hypothetical protein J5N97_018072 [Dioscorea zingiberensis]